MELLRIFRRTETETAPALGPALRGQEAAAANDYFASSAAAPVRMRHRDERPPLPPPLTMYRSVRAEQLGAGTRQALAKLFQNIPRPPDVLSRLLQLDPEDEREHAELSALVATDARLAEHVRVAWGVSGLAARPALTEVGEAIERHGAGRIRAAALSGVLIAIVGSADPERQRLVDEARLASALACEITLQLAQALGFETPGALAGFTALSFLGRLATIEAMPRALLARVPARGLLERSSAEQALLGLSSAEIGRWLMQQWELSPALVEEAAEIDAVLFAPYAAWEPQRAGRLALCYLAARLGERLAHEAALDLAAFDLLEDTDPEMHQLRGYLEHAGFAGVLEELSRPSLLDAVQRLRAAAPR